MSTTNTLRVRSPYIMITTGSNFDTTTYTVRKWEGSLTGSLSAPISHYKTKQKLINSQQNIWINPCPLLREGLEGNINTYTSQSTNYSSSFSLGSGESSWTRIDISRFITGSEIDSGSSYFFVLDGYTEPNESQSLPQILMTGNQRVVSDVFPGKFHFINNNMVSMSYTTNLNNTPVNISLSTSSLNTDYVKSVNIVNGVGVNWVNYQWTSSDASGSITFTHQPTCKSEPYILVFKNKYGVLESLNVSKKSSKAITRTSQEYLRSIVNFEGQIDVTRHTNKQFNVSGEEDYTLNTDYIPEYMNEPIKELILSEELWLQDISGTCYPVMLTDSGLTYKTVLNNKLIQYTFKVKLSHNSVNNIQ